MRAAPSIRLSEKSGATGAAGATAPLLGLAVVGLGGALRMLDLHRHGLWEDEISSFGYAANPLSRLPGLVAQFDVHPPLYYFLVHVATRLGLDPVDAVRVPSVLAGTLTIAAAGLLAWLLWDRVAGLVAASLLALSPFHFWYSREGRMYALAWCLVVLSFLFLVLYARLRGPWVLAGYALISAASLYADETSALALLPQAPIIAGLLIRARPEDRIVWIRLAGGLAAAGLLFGPWLLVLARQAARFHGFAGYQPGLRTALALVLDLFNLSARYATLSHLLVPLPLAAAVGAVVLLAFLGHAGSLAHLASLVAIGLTLGTLAVAAVLLLLGFSAVLVPRVVGMFDVGLAILVAGGSMSLWRRSASSRRRVASAAGAAAAIAIFALSSLLGLAQVAWHGSNGTGWREVAQKMQRSAAPADALIYYPYGVVWAVEDYLPPRSPLRGLGTGDWAMPDELADQRIERWATGHPHIWIAFYGSQGIDMPEHDAWLTSHGYVRVSGDPHAAAGLLEYVSRAGPP
jgi:hypothetical protein